MLEGNRKEQIGQFPCQESDVLMDSAVQPHDTLKGMLVHEALQAAGATEANLKLVLDALKTCDFAPKMPADGSFTRFDVSRHLEHLSPRLKGYILAAQKKAADARQGASQPCNCIAVRTSYL